MKHLPWWTPWSGRKPIALLVAALVLPLSLGASLATAATSLRGSATKSSVSPAVAKGIAAAGAARTVPGVNGGQVTIGISSKNDTSKSLRSMAIPATATQNAKTKVIPTLPLGKRVTNAKPAKSAADTAHTQTKLAAPNMPSAILNFEGIAFPGVNCNCAPPDPNGYIGSTQYVEVVNTGLEVFDKTTGNPLLGPISIESIWSGFGGVCENQGGGDPIVMWDQLANRWIISELGDQSQPTDECVAVSTSADATGTWNRYDFNLAAIFGNDFYDYPKLSVWPDAYYMSFNVFNASGTAFLGPQPFAIDRTAMLAGQPASIQSTGILGPTHDQLMPASLDGSIQPPAGAPNPFTEIGTNPTWALWRYHVDFANPSNSTFTDAGTLDPGPFNVICGGTAGNCVPQAGVPDQLATLGDRSMYRNAYRRFPDGHEALVGNMTVQSNGVAGIKWYEIDNATSGTPGFVQDATYQPDSTWRWMGSAAMDASGDIAIGFSASDSTINPQIRYAGRLASDPPNQLSQGEATLFAGTGSQTGTNNRWGDYSGLTVDPTDGCTFWYTNEYYTTTSSFNWHTRIGNFRFPSCTQASIGTLAGTVTDASNNNPIAGATVSASSGGTSFGSTTTDASGHYSINLPVGTYDVSVSAFGYATATESGVQITANTTTTLNFALTPAPSVTVSGTVTDGSGHGWPLYARIDVAGDPASPFFTDPITGHYSFQVPANATYDVTYTSKLTGYQPNEQSLTVGGGDTTNDVALNVTSDCNAPGYKPDVALSETFDESNNFPPTGWTVQDNIGNGEVWQLNDPQGRSNNTGGTGNFADINSSFYGSGNSQDTSLVTPTLDLSGASAPVLTFHNNYLLSLLFPFPQTGDVDVSIDGGNTWTNVWHHGADAVPGPDLETVPLPQAAGQSNVKLRFHFTATFAGLWMVDDVTVVKGDCVKLPGGLVEGNVYDLNTGDPINGATVTSNDAPTDTATTAAVPDDPNNPGGFYWLFSSLTGSHPFTAKASVHSDDTETVDVARDGTVRQDFHLGVGHLVISPTSISSTQVLGSTTTQTLSFHNDGSGAAHVNLSERFTDVPWLDESPTEFGVPAGGTVDVTVSLTATTDAGVTQPGTYSAQLVVSSPNTPQTFDPIDVTMNVTPPKDWGRVAGTVTGTDCQGNTAPLQDAQIQATGKNGWTFSLNTDDNGQYAFWAPTKANPFTILASKDFYESQTKAIKVKRGVTVTVDFALQAVC